MSVAEKERKRCKEPALADGSEEEECELAKERSVSHALTLLSLCSSAAQVYDMIQKKQQGVYFYSGTSANDPEKKAAGAASE